MGGLYINDQRINLEEANKFEKNWLIGEKFMVVRFGKKNYHLFEFEIGNGKIDNNH